MSELFTSVVSGTLTLPNRVIMAPLTRCRAGAGQVPTPLMATYYGQRASAGLIISEATQVCPGGMGYPNTPGIHSPEQIVGWRRVTEAVHTAGGRIFAQLWHVGRVSHTAYQPDGGAPVSSSAVGMNGTIMLPDFSEAPRPMPRTMELHEIAAMIEQYRHAAKCAKDAGFDGVELHGANGYLPDQFLRDGVNKRTDRYGGSIQNRARFHIELTQALCDVWGPGRVGVRLSPSGTFNQMRDSSPRETFGHLVRELGAMNLAYLHIMEAMEGDLKHGRDEYQDYEPIPVSYFRPLFKGTLITNSGFDYDKATKYVKEGWADAVAFGAMFIANPDLPERFRRLASGVKGVPFNSPDPATFYGGAEKGYTDYPVLA